jgi:vitamin B12 transport system substrate-binding protein
MKITLTLLLGILTCCFTTNLLASNNDNQSGAQRIIALSPHSVELLFTLGVGDRIVAASDFADFPEQAKSIPRVGGNYGINFERILLANPDLVIVWEGGNNAADIERLRQMGFNLFVSKTSRLEQIADELQVLGELIGKPKAGLSAADKFRQDLESLRETYQHLEPVSFFYQIWPNPLQGVASGSWISEIVAGCGGQNILSGSTVDYPMVSLENIVLKMPQVILLPSQPGTDQWQALDWSAWQEIPAVANSHVFSINGDLLHRFSTRVLQGMSEVCSHIQSVRDFNS